jgi:drug/metabolite transporter (DMT)-like permease
MTDQRKAYAYGLATVMLWSTVATAFKLTLRELDVFELTFLASGFSLATLGAVLALQGNLMLAFRPGRRGLLLSAGLGALNPALYYLTLFAAYDLLPAQEAQPLNYTWAVTLALLSIPLLKQKITGADFAALGVSYFGVVVISTRGDLLGLEFANPLGVGLALLSTVIWALYWIYNTKDDRDPVVGLFTNFAFGFAYLAAAALLFGRLPSPSASGLAGSAYVGVFEMGVSFVFWLKALKLSENTAKVGTLIFISPFLSLVFISLFVGEEIMGSTIVGLVFIMGGIALQQIGSRRAGKAVGPDG